MSDVTPATGAYGTVSDVILNCVVVVTFMYFRFDATQMPIKRAAAPDSTAVVSGSVPAPSPIATAAASSSAATSNVTIGGYGSIADVNNNANTTATTTATTAATVDAQLEPVVGNYTPNDTDAAAEHGLGSYGFVLLCFISICVLSPLFVSYVSPLVPSRNCQ